LPSKPEALNSSPRAAKKKVYCRKENQEGKEREIIFRTTSFILALGFLTQSRWQGRLWHISL
jgi:hypothetical protein